MSEPPVHSEGELTGLRHRNFQFRAESRYKPPLAAIAYLRGPDGAEGRETVWLANVSHHGLGLLSKKSIPHQASLHIEIPALVSMNRQLTATVVHATQQLNGDWLIGCLLNTPLNYDELEACLALDSPFFSQLKK
jgi:hypothetical protein